MSLRQDIGFAPALGLTWGFTGKWWFLLCFEGSVLLGLADLWIGALLGVYATTNGLDGQFKTWVEDWRYFGQGQVID